MSLFVGGEGSAAEQVISVTAFSHDCLLVKREEGLSKCTVVAVSHDCL